MAQRTMVEGTMKQHCSRRVLQSPGAMKQHQSMMLSSYTTVFQVGGLSAAVRFFFSFDVNSSVSG